MNTRRIFLPLVLCLALTAAACGEEADPVDISISVDGSSLEVTGLESEQDQEGDNAVGDYVIETDSGDFTIGLTAPGLDLPAADDFSDPETFSRAQITWTDDDGTTWTNDIASPVQGAIAWDPTGGSKTVLSYDGMLQNSESDTVMVNILIEQQEKE